MWASKRGRAARLGAWVAVLMAAPGFSVAGPDSTQLQDPTQGDWIRPADILYVGDSESLGYFGENLYRALATERDPKTGHALTVWSYWTCGSDVPSWYSGATAICGVRTCTVTGRCSRDDGPGHVRYAPLQTYLALVHPRVTIISLGTNMLTTHHFESPSFYAFYLDVAGKLAAQIAQARSACIWVGPPQAATFEKPVADYERFVGDLGRAVAAKHCRFIDSNALSDRGFVLKGDPEGTHYRSEGEKAWEAKAWTVVEPILRQQLGG